MKKAKICLFVTAFLAVFVVLPSFTSAATADEIQAQINALMTQIKQLQEQLAQLQPQPATWCHDFNVNLKVGDSGSEVNALYGALQREGFTKELQGEEGDFGEWLASAVSGFQQKYKDEILTPLGLKYGTGFVGKATRAKLNKLYGCGVTPKPIPPCPSYSPRFCDEEPAGAITGCPPPPQCIPRGNQPPTIHGVSGPTTLKVRETGTWTVRASDPEQGALSYSVRWGDENITGLYSAAQRAWGYVQTAEFTHSYATAGIYNPTFTVADDKGLGAKTSISVNVGAVTQPSITVLSPNGGETWQIGSTQTIKWNSVNNNYVIIDLVRGSNNAFVKSISTGNSGAAGQITWQIPSDILSGNDYKIRINGADSVGVYKSNVFDYSDAAFSIVAAGTPSITVLSPNGGETYKAGGNDSITVKWSTQNVPPLTNLDIIRLRNYRTGVEYPLAYSVVNDGSETVTIPANVPPDPYTLEIKSYYNNILLFDQSDSYFKVADVVQPSITVLSPNGGEGFYAGQTVEVKWFGQPSNYYIQIALLPFSSSNTTVTGPTLVQSTINDGSAMVVIPSTTVPGSYVMSVSIIDPATNAGPFDRSDAAFSIAAATANLPDITVTAMSFLPLSPKVGDEITFTSTIKNIGTAAVPSGSNFYVCDYFDNIKTNCNSYSSLAAGESFVITWTRTLNWPSQFTAGNHIFKVVADDNQVVTESSEGNNSNSIGFTVLAPSITVLSPNGGESWAVGTTQTIKWNRFGNFPSGGRQVIYLWNNDNKSVYNVHTSAIDNTETSLAWIVLSNSVLPPGNNYQIEVFSTDANGSVIASDKSDAAFSIVAAITPTVSVELSGSQSLTKGVPLIINWKTAMKACRAWFGGTNEVAHNLPGPSSLLAESYPFPTSNVNVISPTGNKYDYAIRCFDEATMNKYNNDTRNIPSETTEGIRVEKSVLVLPVNCSRCSNIYKYAYANNFPVNGPCDANAAPMAGWQENYTVNCACTIGTDTARFPGFVSQCTSLTTVNCGRCSNIKRGTYVRWYAPDSQCENSQWYYNNRQETLNSSCLCARCSTIKPNTWVEWAPYNGVCEDPNAYNQDRYERYEDSCPAVPTSSVNSFQQAVSSSDIDQIASVLDSMKTTLDQIQEAINKLKNQ